MYTDVWTNLQHLEHGPRDIVIQSVVVPELLLKLHWLAQVPGLCQQLEQLQSLVKGRPLPLQAEVTTKLRGCADHRVSKVLQNACPKVAAAPCFTPEMGFRKQACLQDHKQATWSPACSASLATDLAADFADNDCVIRAQPLQASPQDAGPLVA